MKKLFFAMMAIVALFATSCQKEASLDGVPGAEATVTFNIGTPEIATRAYSDGTTATQLQYAVYDADGNHLTGLDGTTTINITAKVDLQLTTGNTYDVIFWAAAPGAPYSVDFAAKLTDAKMTVDYTNAVSNDENRDAFFVRHTFEVKGAQTETVKLSRPFAQLNIGTADYAASTSAGYTPTHSAVTVAAYNTLFFHDGSVNGRATVVFGENAIDKTQEFPVAGNEYLAMNYLLVATTKDVVDIEFTYTDGSNLKSRKVGSVPVQRNYRTNIYGSLLTSDVDINVIIVPEYDEPSLEADELFKAAAFGGDVVLTGDVTLNLPLSIQANMTLDLNGYTLTGAINVAKDVQVTINNGKVVNSDKAVSGITSNGHLVLNNVEVESARHALRIESGYALINGGTYKVAPVSKSTLHALNVGDGATSVAEVIVKGGTFIGPKGTMADSGAAVTVKAGSSVAIEGGDFSGGKINTLSGDAIVVTGGSFDQKPSKYIASGYKAVEKDGKYYVVEDIQGEGVVVTTAAELTDAIANAATDLNIFLGNDIVGNVTAVQKENVKVTIVGNNKKINGVILVDGKSQRYPTTGLTIQGVEFVGGEKTANLEAYINLGEKSNNNTRYTNNVTIKDCTFAGEGEVLAAVKSYTGGDRNLSISGCTVKAGMHSFLQVTNVEEGLTVEGCQVYSKNGINLNNTPTLAMDGCTFDVKGYAIRVGVTGAVNAEKKFFTVSNSNLKSACEESGDAVIIIRNNAANAELNLTGTTLVGTPDILGAVEGKTTITR